MGTVNFQLVNEDLLLEEQSDRFVCKMLVCPDRYDYLLFDNKKNPLAFNQVITSSDTEREFNIGFLLQNLNSDKLTKLDKREESIVHSFPYFSLVPGKLFDKAQLHHYIGKEDVQAFHDKIKIKGEELVLVHAVPQRFHEGLAKKHGKAHYTHVIGAMLTEMNKSKAQDLCSVFVANKHLFIGVMKSGRFLGVNYYDYQDLNDLLYYISLNYQNYKLDRNKVGLRMHGYFEKDSALIRLLSMYYSKVEFGQVNQEYLDKTGIEVISRLFEFVG